MKNLAVVIVCALALWGCGPTEGEVPNRETAKPTAVAATNSIVGKWDSTASDGVTVFEFKDDGTMSKTKSGPDNADPKFTDSIIQSGTYKIDGDKYTSKTTGVSMESGNPAMKAEVEKANKDFAAQVGVIPDENGTVKWISKDEVELTTGPTDKPNVYKLKRQAK